MKRILLGQTQSFAVLLLITLIAGGCVSRPKGQASPGELLILGQEDLKSERFDAARLAFKRLLREYPDSKHRRQALLNLADSYYKAEEYLEAKVQYSEFVQLYPISPYTSKAYYFLGMSDFNRTLDFDQDQSTTRDAIKNFNEMIKRFPKSKYAAEGKEKLLSLRKRQAEHEIFIARFYLKRGNRVSAIPRFRDIVKEYLDIPEIRAEAIYYLGESYRLEESYQKAGQEYRNLINEHPESPHAQTAYNRLLDLTGKR
ncbi:MAG: outer membrane protein assembly factor BamD [bacterium]